MRPQVIAKPRAHWLVRERTPSLPTNLAAEVTILGAILIDNAFYAEATATLKDEDFSLDSHKRIFLRMTELMESNHAVDIVTLAESMSKHEIGKPSEIAQVGGVAYLASLTEGLPRRPVIKEYIAIVKEKAKLRRIMLACQAASHKAETESYSASVIVTALGVDLRGIK